MSNKLIILMALMAMIAPAFAVSNTMCLNANTLERNITITTNGTSTTITEDMNCPYGCANNQCTPAATLNQSNSLIIVLLFAAILASGVYAESNPLMILSGLIGMILAVALGTQGILLDSVLVKNSITGGMGAVLAFGSLYLIIGSVAEWRTKTREE